ncbi:hypothetical protein [Streptomyces xiaopingdaonensis]|uniref:hypothetical protein n=1 Tax=Streptomyces xiaopingdaonensis TaxID=1565415 RepID=UPI0002D320A4|nr:hypothetical protein [Streptomyces xiaopingdaonensis]
MFESVDVRELRLGVYGVHGATSELAREARDLLSRRLPGGWLLEERTAETPSEPGDALSIGELYAELPEQWRIEHPGADPGERRVVELRVGVRTSASEARELSEALCRLACPDLAHEGPCALPWSSSVLDPVDEETRDELRERYGPLA